MKYKVYNEQPTFTFSTGPHITYHRFFIGAIWAALFRHGYTHTTVIERIA